MWSEARVLDLMQHVQAFESGPALSYIGVMYSSGTIPSWVRDRLVRFVLSYRFRRAMFV